MNLNRASSEGPAVGRSRQCILVVEDELLIRFMLSDELRECGYQVIEACDATEALEILDSSAPDLIISDVRMPGPIDGLDMLARVKERLPELPVIIVSAHLHPERAMIDGAIEFVAKPYRFEQVLDAVKRGLAKKA